MPSNPYQQFKESPLGNPSAQETASAPEGNPYAAMKDPFTSIYKQGVESSAIMPEQYDEGVDYSTGVDNFEFRSDLSRMDTAEEKAMMLDKWVGKDNWDIDSSGRYILWEEGMEALGLEGGPTAIDEVGLSKGDVADLRGDAPAIAAGVGVGMATGGLGVLPTMGAVALGTMGAKGLDETADALRGENLQSSGEVAADLITDAGLAITGEGVARSVMPIGRYIMAPGQKIPVSGSTFAERLKQRLIEPRKESVPKVAPKRTELTNQALEMGAVPGVHQATERSITGRVQGMIEQVFGPNSFRTATNVEAINTRAAELSERVPKTSGSGRKTRLKLSRKLANAKNAFEQAENYVRDQARANVNRARDLVNRGNSEDAATAIRNAKSSFDDEMAVLYGQVDELIGGKEIVSSKPMKDMARLILDELPKTESGNRAFISPEAQRSLKEILQLSDKMTFQQAQRARTALREAAENPDLLGNIGKRDLSRLKQSVDESLSPDQDFSVLERTVVFDEQGFPRIENAEIPVEEGKTAAELLKRAGEAYANGIKVFDDELVRRISRDPSVAGAIPPSKVAETVSRADPDVIRNLKSVVDEKTWGNILDDHLEGLYLRSEKVDGDFSPVLMYNNINRMGERFNAMYGKDALEVRRLIREASAKNADVNLNGLDNASDMTLALREAVERRNALDELMGSNKDFVKKIENGSLTDDQVVSYIWRKGDSKNPELLRSVRTMLGKDSQEWAAIQRKAMDGLLEHMRVESDDAVEILLNGAGLDDAIKAYGKDNMNIMFGKELADDLAKFAETTKFLTSRNNLSGGIVAANIALHPEKNIGKLAWMNVLGRILSSPNTIRYFTEGLRAPRTRAGAAAMTRAVSQMMQLVDSESDALPPIEEK